LPICTGSKHVAEEGLAESPDLDVREYAKTAGLVILSADPDFCELAMTIGSPPKIV
jgi:predicted nuclease of predicted toxin-antitoxin system